jgi:hypothetical protein
MTKTNFFLRFIVKNFAVLNANALISIWFKGNWNFLHTKRPVWSGPGVALKILLFRVDLNVGIEDFRVLVNGCTTVVTGRHRIVVKHAVRGRLFGGKIAEHGELF